MRLFEWIVGKSTKSECDRLKDENERLSKQIVSLLGEIQEASAYYDFETARLEKKIAELLENKESLIKTLQESEKHLVDRQWKIDSLHNENSSLEADLCMLQDEIQSVKKLARAQKDIGSDEYIKKWWAKAPVQKLNLSVRINQCLASINVHTIGDLLAKTESELSEIKNFGHDNIGKIKETLASFGLTLKPDYMRCVNNPDFTLKMTRYEKLKPQTDFVKAIDAAMTKKRGRPRKQRD
jgi:DNA repair exonuclease SbcCD ATPase subunit